MRTIALAACCALASARAWAGTPQDLERTANAYDDAWQDGPTGWVAHARALATAFKGTRGLVVLVGDSITYANPGTQWIRFGKGRTAADDEIRRYMHVDDADRRLDGFYLARTDMPGGRSYTAESGMTTGQFLSRPRRGLPNVHEMFGAASTADGELNAFVGTHAAEVCFLMLGTNDASAGRPAAEFRANMTTIVARILAQGTIVVAMTIPPHCAKPDLARAYNDELRAVARTGVAVKGVNGGAPVALPLVDFWQEIVSRRPGDSWNGTLLGKDDVHPSAGDASADPYAGGGEALARSGYLLRCWLVVQKMKEIKARAIDPAARR